MSYDLTVFKTGKSVPTSIEEIDIEDVAPIGDYNLIKSNLSSYCPDIVWNDTNQRGQLENDIGWFEFNCFAEALQMDSFGIAISFRQDLEASLYFLSALLKKAGFFAIDDQSMKIIGS